MSVGMYVGKNLTEDGSVFLGSYGDEPSSHYLTIVNREKHKEDAVLEVGVTREADYPGYLIEIPQVERTNKYITNRYSYWKGLPAPLENGGLNEHRVAGAAIWSPSRKELREVTPDLQAGANFSDLSKIAMQRATSAREAVEIIGSIIDEYGYATYGGNSHIFADPNEGWIIIEFAGGRGLWIAERLGPDDIRVARPGYIGKIPPNFLEHPDYMGSENLISFAVKQGWYDPGQNEKFNVSRVYQRDKQPDQPGHQVKDPGVIKMEGILNKRSPIVSLIDMMKAVRSPYITSETAGYGQVAHLRDDIPSELTTLWAASGPAITCPFIPYPIGVTSIPVEYKKHRYLSKGESRKFIASDFQGRESTCYAFRIYKRLFHLISEYPKEFRKEVVDTLQAFEEKTISELHTLENTAVNLHFVSEKKLMQESITNFSNKTAKEGLEVVKILSESIELRTRLFYGIREPGDKEKDEWVNAVIDEEFFPWEE